MKRFLSVLIVVNLILTCVAFAENNNIKTVCSDIVFKGEKGALKASASVYGDKKVIMVISAYDKENRFICAGAVKGINKTLETSPVDARGAEKVKAFVWEENIENVICKAVTMNTYELFGVDFSLFEPGDMPDGYNKIIASGCTLTTELTEGYDGKKINALVFEDNIGDSSTLNTAFYRNFDKITNGEISMEFRFKVEGEPGFAAGMYLRSNGSWVSRIAVRNDNRRFDYIPDGYLSEYKEIVHGKWYKVKVVINMDNGRARVFCESDALSLGYVYAENLALSYDADSIDSMMFETRNLTGKLYIDYFKVEAGKNFKIEVPEFVHPEPEEAPICAAPVMRRVPECININVNGTYMYFATKPYREGENIMVTTQGAFRAFGFVPDVMSGLTAKKNGTLIEIMPDSNIISINCVEKELLIPVTKKDGNYVISMNELADVLGYDSEYVKQELSLYITARRR